MLRTKSSRFFTVDVPPRRTGLVGCQGGRSGHSGQESILERNAGTAAEVRHDPTPHGKGSPRELVFIKRSNHGWKNDVALKSKFLRLLLACKLMSRHVEEAAQSAHSSNNEMKCCACEK